MWSETPSPDRLSRLLWQDVFIQRSVREGGDQPVGLFQVSSIRFDDGVADLDFLLDPTHVDEIDGGLQMFLGQVFDSYPLRKLCLAICSDDFELTPCLASLALQVGCLVEHRRRGRDRFADINLYEIWADGSPS